MNKNYPEKESLLATQLEDELEKINEKLVHLQRTSTLLKKEDEMIQQLGANFMEFIKSQIKNVREQMDEVERELIDEERKHFNTKSKLKIIKNSQVCLTEKELNELHKLSSDYKAFEKHIKIGINKNDTKYEEVCLWNACWTCTASCGGCTGCGQACTQIGNALSGSHHKGEQ